jgi:transketolase
LEILSRVHAKNLVEWAKDKPEVLVLSADLTSSTEIDLFRGTYPERFFSMGVAEQNMLSMAGGLAREGFVPYVHTFAVFIYRRAFDQIAMSVSYPNMPVKMFGFLPGIMTPGGASHQAIEDIALMRALPNMTVLEVADATEIETILDAVHSIDGPVYVRMLRGEVPRLFSMDEPFKLGKVRKVSEGNDITIVTSGICTEEAMRASKALAQRGVSVEHVHVSTLKPFDGSEVIGSLTKAKHGVITMENHTVIGGLGSIIAECIADNGLGCRLKRIGLNDVYAHGASKKYLMREHGIDAMALIAHVEDMMGAEFNITEDELDDTHMEAVHSMSKPEAL